MKSVTNKTKWNFQRHWQLYVLLMLAVLLGILFNYRRMPGIVMAFQDFKPWFGLRGPPWAGIEHFNKMMDLAESRQAMRNTLVVSFLKIIF